MKKLLSLVLAAAMLAAVSVPSFAAEINKDTADGKGVATVKTDTTNVPADGYFTVTYPAEMSVNGALKPQPSPTMLRQLSRPANVFPFLLLRRLAK